MDFRKSVIIDGSKNFGKRNRHVSVFVQYAFSPLGAATSETAAVGWERDHSHSRRPTLNASPPHVLLMNEFCAKVTVSPYDTEQSRFGHAAAKHTVS